MKDKQAMPQHKQLKILLIGDNGRDEYHYGTVDRLSPEAPVPIFKFEKQILRPGMAGNVEQNLLALGCEVDFLRTQISKKVRLIDSRSKYHIARIDYDLACEPVCIDSTKTDYDAVIISDYNKGTVTYDTIDLIQNNFTCPIFLDTKKTDAERFGKCFLKINEKEFNSLKSNGNNMIVTRGDKSVQYYNHNNLKTYSVPKIEVHDVCGAGDTFLASLCYAYLCSNNIDLSVEFAIKAASITIQHIGTYAPGLGEIKCS